jgi:hypothetical protein
LVNQKLYHTFQGTSVQTADCRPPASDQRQKSAVRREAARGEGARILPKQALPTFLFPTPFQQPAVIPLGSEV